MIDFLRKNILKILCFCIIIFTIPVMLLVENPFGYGIFSREIGIALLGYFGTIFGALIAVSGVWLTIKENREQLNQSIEENRKLAQEDKAVQFRPILKYDFIKLNKGHQATGEIIFLMDEKFFMQSQPFYINKQIVLKNIGRGEMEISNIRISDYSVTATFFDTDEKTFLDHVYFLGTNYIKFLPVEEVIYIQLGFAKVKEEYIDFLPNDTIALLNITLEIEYTGIFSEDKYVQTLNFNIDLKHHDGKYSCNFFNSKFDLKIENKDNAQNDGDT